MDRAKTMIKNPYKDIKQEVIDVLHNIIDKEDSYHQGHSRRMARTLEVLLEQNPQGKILEIGTTGLIPLALKKLKPEVTVFGTDFNLEKPPMGVEKYTFKDQSIDVQVVRVNIEEDGLKFIDEYFDVVLLCEVIEHMERDPMAMLSQVNRVLKTGGVLILTTPNAVSSHSISKILNGYEPYFYMQYRHDGSMYRHNYEYSIHSLTAVLNGAGFDGKIWTEDCFEDPIVSIPLMLEQLGYKPQNYGDNLFACMKKVSGVIDRYPKEIYVD